LGTFYEGKEILNLHSAYQRETLHQNLDNFVTPRALLSHIYYTESDQLLHMDSPETRDMILKSLNMSVHLIGRRREKKGDSDPSQPYRDLYNTRTLCGNASDLFVLDPDRDFFVRRRGP
jgi:hypothetical protein